MAGRPYKSVAQPRFRPDWSGGRFLNDVCLRDQDKKTAAGEVYRIEIPAPVDAVPRAEEIPLDIVYEDSDLLVINKPAGMVVHPAAGNYDGTLVNALLSHCRDSLSGIGGVIRPGIVHRLDKETSGLMVIAKNDEAHKGLSAQFAVHSLQRCYLALVWGRLSPAQGAVENQIGRSPVNRKKWPLSKPAANGRKHITGPSAFMPAGRSVWQNVH